MIKTRLAFLVCLGVCWLATMACQAQPASNLCVMTYNLRFASPRPPNAWPDRRPLVRECITSVSPDVFGTQEGVYYQLKDLAADLPDYDWIGLGRDGGSKGEFMAVFFRKSRLEPMAFDHYWLSDTPEMIASTTWGNSNRRMVTWVLFKDKTTGRQFYFINTHFDHQIQEAREKSARLVRQRVEALGSEFPILLVGDFNAVSGKNEAWHILTRDGFFKDTWNTAAKRENEKLATFNGFKAAQETGERIDWILSRGETKAHKTAIIPFAPNNQFPSDHFPVVAWISLE